MILPVFTGSIIERDPSGVGLAGQICISNAEFFEGILIELFDFNGQLMTDRCKWIGENKSYVLAVSFD